MLRISHMTAAEQKYYQLDKEALAIVFGVKKHHQYLYGRRFELKTDHKPLIHIFSESKATPTMASGRIQRWALTLGAYSYNIQYRKGEENSNADALSRLPQETYCTKRSTQTSRDDSFDGIPGLVIRIKYTNQNMDGS